MTEHNGIYVRVMVEMRESLIRLKGAKLACLMCVALHWNGKDSWPSVTTIMAETGYSNREVIDSLRELETDGWISSRKAHRQASHYQVTTPFLQMGVSSLSEVTSPKDDSCMTLLHPTSEVTSRNCVTLLHSAGEVTSLQEETMKKKPSEEETKKNNEHVQSVEKPAAKPKPVVKHQDEFELFWQAYPRQEVRSRALKCWNARMRAGVDPEEIIRGAKHYAEYVNSRGTTTEYIKLPATFLGPEEHWKMWQQARQVETVKASGQWPEQGMGHGPRKPEADRATEMRVQNDRDWSRKSDNEVLRELAQFRAGANRLAQINPEDVRLIGLGANIARLEEICRKRNLDSK